MFETRLKAELPAGADVYDAHTHLGNDIDGMSGSLEELLGVMDRYGISRANMFCLDEPDRHPAFTAANDRTLAYAEKAEGRLVPFVRLDLSETPIEEATRCLDRGARGIKLHPRAQKFLLDDERLSPIFELAHERRVPILIHAGRGLPPIADDLLRVHERFPATLILAHAGIADLAGLAGNFAGRKGVFFDTSVWSPVDLLGFFRLVPPEQIVYASDYPYGLQPQSLVNTLRTARSAGLDEAQIRMLLAENANRIADGEGPLEPSQPQGAQVLAQPMAHARIHQYLSMAMAALFARQQDSFGALGLALNATYERNGHAEDLVEIRGLLEAARDVWRTLPEADDADDARMIARTSSRLIHLADVLSVTSGA